MSIKVCISRAQAMNVITRDEADTILKRYDQIMADGVDAARARARLQKEIEAEAEHRERAALLSEAARSAAVDALQGFRDHRGNQNLLVAWKAMHENMGHIGSFVQDAEGRRDAIFKEMTAGLADVVHELHRGAVFGDLSRTSKMVGSQKQQIRMADMLRELYGKSTGDPIASAMAKAWQTVSEKLRMRFNEAGGNIGKLKGYDLPHAHDPLALHPTGMSVVDAKAKWIGFVTPLLDRDKMVSHLTGERLSDGDLARGLEVAWDRIVTDGYSDKDVSARAGKGALYTQHMDHRFLHFKDADAWMHYAEHYGNRDMFSAIMGHVSVMARDIAHMEVFGPNPNMLRDYIKEWIKSQAAQQKLAGAKVPTNDKINAALARADAMWQLQRGVAPGSQRMADLFQSARNYITATGLPGAFLSALTDPAAGQDTRLRLGMSFANANFARVMVLGLKDTLTRGGREAAVDGMLGLDSAAMVLRQKAKEVSGFDHRFWSGYIADRTLTWTLLTPWTQAGKHMVGQDIYRFIGSQATKAFGELPAGLQKAFTMHGFSPADWDKIRSVEIMDGTHLRPNEIMAKGAGLEGRAAAEWRDLAERYIQLVSRETRHAVPESTVESRSIVSMSAPPGTIIGEMVRSSAQFKGFGLSVWFLHMSRIAREIAGERTAGGKISRAGYGAALLFTSTMLGAMSMALKDVKAGRDPRKWLDEKTWLDLKHWGAAILQSGGFGIYGDLLFSETNRFGAGLAETLAGPMVSRAKDLLSIGAEIKAKSEGKQANFGAWAAKNMRGNIPFANHWLWSVYYQNVLMDGIQRHLDPRAQASFNNRVQTRARDYRQGYWWRPGTSGPQRAPDLTRLVATR